MQYLTKREAVNSGMLSKAHLSSEEEEEEDDDEQKSEEKVAFLRPELSCHMVVDNSLYEDY